MNRLTLTDLSQAQQDRLAHIDFTLLFRGEANRSYLVERFGVAPSVVTQDFSRYKELAPNNVAYDEKRRVHIKTKSFSPIFDYDVIRTLATISQGFGDGFIGKSKPPLPCEAPHHLNKPELKVVAAISEAIHKKTALGIEYSSLSNGKGEREIVPHSLVDTGLRWHVRAYDRKSSEFRDFVLTRIGRIKTAKSEVSVETETIDCDKQWNRIVELELIPHPKLKYKDAISMEYAMTDGCLQVELRASFVGYLLRLWNVDCSSDKGGDAFENHLALKNPEALYGVDNARLAPGYMGK